MSKLGKAMADYLALRRALGFKLGRTETRLRQFLAFMEGKRTTTLRFRAHFVPSVPSEKKRRPGGRRRSCAPPALFS
jgi:hypothetical protein